MSVSGVSSSTDTSGTSSGSSSLTSSSSAVSEEMFLKLLVAQLQNQDPMNPADSTQFVSQLAQFSQLEQVIGIRGDIESYMGTSSSSTGTGTGTSGTSSTSGS